MREEAAFLRQLRADPAYLATLLVYADWLDDHGHEARARFLRLQQRLIDTPDRQKGVMPLNRELRGLAAGLSDAWLRVVSRPRVAGTCWAGRSGREAYVYRFLSRGALDYTSPTGTYQNGTWTQVGNYVTLETNRHFADCEGYIVGGHLRGTGRNITGATWRWHVQLTTDPKLCRRGKPVRTVYDDHLRT